MFRKLLMVGALAGVTLATGCASVPMASLERDAEAKTFATKPDKSNIYVYRNEIIGAAIKMDVLLNGQLVGQTAAQTFLALEVPPGKHTLISKAENDSVLDLVAEGGKNYFVWQEVKMGALYARSRLQLMDEAAGRAGVAECKRTESNK